MRYLAVLLCLFLLGGCATKSTLKGEGPGPLVDSWETSKAIIKAADASGNFGVAMNAAAQEVERNPKNNEARLILARLQTLEGRPTLALETLQPLAGGEGATASDPAVLLEQGRAQLALKDRGTARGLLEKCLSSTQNSGIQREAKKLLAVISDEDGNHKDAQAIYEQLLAERDEVSVRYNFGRSLLSSKDYAKSSSILMPLVDLSDLPQARLVAAAALVKNGEAKAARNLLQGYMPEGDIDRVLEGHKR